MCTIYNIKYKVYTLCFLWNRYERATRCVFYVTYASLNFSFMHHWDVNNNNQGNGTIFDATAEQAKRFHLNVSLHWSAMSTATKNLNFMRWSIGVILSPISARRKAEIFIGPNSIEWRSPLHNTSDMFGLQWTHSFLTTFLNKNKLWWCYSSYGSFLKGTVIVTEMDPLRK